MLWAENLTEQMIGLAIEAPRHTDHGLLEAIYEQCHCQELMLAGISFASQVMIPVVYKDVPISQGFRAVIVVRAPGHSGDQSCPPSFRRMRRHSNPAQRGRA